MSEKTIIAYVPVLSSNYLKFFREQNAETLYILGRDLYEEIECLVRDIRALKSHEIVVAVQAQNIFNNVRVLSKTNISRLDPDLDIIMPDEDISRVIAKGYLHGYKIEYVKCFLRYDMPATTTKHPVVADQQISSDEFDRKIMGLAADAAAHSPDWWRQVGGALVAGSEVLFVAYNEHLPTNYSLLETGDPRNNFVPGEYIDLSRARHAERALIARAACRGIQTQGLSIYVTTFPCYPCADAIVTAGIKKVYFRDGYSSLEGQEYLEANGVEIIKVI